MVNLRDEKLSWGLAFSVGLAWLSIAAGLMARANAQTYLAAKPSAAILSTADTEDHAQLTTQLEEVLHPFWVGPQMDGESALFVKAADDQPATASLLFIPTKIIKVTNNQENRVFEQGKDFLWTPGTRKLTLTPNSRIPFMTVSELHPAQGTPTAFQEAVGGKTAMYIDRKGSTLQGMQVVVTYDHSETWAGYIPPAGDPHLARTIAKLQAGKPIKLVVLGDSISAGAAASGYFHGPPFQPPYAELVPKALEKLYGNTVTLKNLSVGGKRSEWGIEMAPAVAAEKPDLVIVAFGANDATFGVPAATYARNIRNIIETIKQKAPETDFLLIATMLANPEWGSAKPLLCIQYRDALARMVRPGIAMADMTSLWAQLLERKKFVDLSGNGINHPNDFGYRVYAQVIVQMLSNKERLRTKQLRAHK